MWRNRATWAWRLAILLSQTSSLLTCDYGDGAAVPQPRSNLTCAPPTSLGNGSVIVDDATSLAAPDDVIDVQTSASRAEVDSGRGDAIRIVGDDAGTSTKLKRCVNAPRRAGACP